MEFPEANQPHRKYGVWGTRHSLRARISRRAFPDIRVGLRQSNVSQHATHELLRHLSRVHGSMVESGDDGEDDRACVGGQGHVAQMDPVEGRLANTENERTALLEAYVGRAFDQVGGESMGDAGKRAHAARQDDHAC
jgi:hypothetical protein